jgi:DNA repair protein RadC
MAIRDWPLDERPREKLLDKGAAALSDAELLAILLRTGTPGHSALDLAREVLKNFHSLRKLIASDRKRFCAEPGLGPTRFAELQAAVEIARRQLTETLRAGPSLASPRATRDYLSARLRDLEHEVFCCLYLDKRHRLIHFEEMFRGTIDGASVHPREIVKAALQRNCAAIIIAHNHPLCFVWGVTTPVIGHCVRMECANPSSEKEGDGESCPVASDRITPVSPSRRLRCSRARARSSTRRVAVRPACDGWAAA